MGWLDSNCLEEFMALLQHLLQGTRQNELMWRNEEAFGFFVAERKNIRYVLDNPRDGKPELSIDGVLVFRGYELGALRGAILDQDRRLHPRQEIPPDDPLNPCIWPALEKALKTFKEQ